MTLSKDHGIASEESMLRFIKEMKRAGNDDASSSSFEFSILGALIAPAVEKYLRCHVLGYCYRSFSILRKTCKALHWLLSHEECWCYGIDRELRLRIREWPPKIIELFASRFNLCFDAWPAKMPCRPKLPSRNNRLAWMFQRDGDDVFLIREEDYFAIVVPLNNVLEVAPNLRREFIIFLWFPQLGEFAISRRWMFTENAEPGAPNPTFPAWTFLPASIMHECTMYTAKAPESYRFRCAIWPHTSVISYDEELRFWEAHADFNFMVTEQGYVIGDEAVPGHYHHSSQLKPTV